MNYVTVKNHKKSNFYLARTLNLFTTDSKSWKILRNHSRIANVKCEIFCQHKFY